MPAQQATRFCLTVNGVAADTAHALPAHPRERYAAWQLERGANGGNIHVQAYVELHTRATCNSLVNAFTEAGWPHPHVEIARGSPESCRDYCMKEDTREPGEESGPWERGEFGRGGQGKRNDLADACNTLRTHGIKRVAEEHPTTYVKFHRGLKELERMTRPLPSDDAFEPYDWQQHVIDWLHPSNVDDRHVLWVYDAAGNRGKSRLARHLVLEHGAVLLEGRVQDMAYTYNREPIVIIDLSRAQLENVKHLYAFAEKLKNGMLHSTKYEPEVKIFNPPHVVFFANVSWDRDMWTNDRVVEVDLSVWE